MPQEVVEDNDMQFQHNNQKKRATTTVQQQQPLVLLDEGANHGWFSLLAAALTYEDHDHGGHNGKGGQPSWRAIAYEPVPSHCARFQESIGRRSLTLCHHARIIYDLSVGKSQ